MSNIPSKFMEDLILKKITQKDSGAVIEETEEMEDFKGAVFPLSGSDYKLLVEGMYKVGTVKLYTYKDIVDDPKEKIYHKVRYKGKDYQLTNKKEWHTDQLKTYLMEVLD